MRSARLIGYPHNRHHVISEEMQCMGGGNARKRTRWQIETMTEVSTLDHISVIIVSNSG